MLQTKKKSVSKRSKKSWRKNIDTKDVDAFLEDQRLVERLGGPFENKKDEELFFVSKKPFDEDVVKLSRKEKAKQPPKCFEILYARSAVPDPVGKRNRHRTKEEKMDPIRKKIKEMKRAQGIIPKQEMDAKMQRERMYKESKILRRKNKKVEFNKDAWIEEKTEFDNFEGKNWLQDDTIRHTLTNTRSLKVQVPKDIQKKTSILPPIETPHPGVSYNPSYKDHQELLSKVAEQELKIQKEEEHLKRVTTGAFCKISPDQNEANWIKEMSEGLMKKDEEGKTLLEKDNATNEDGPEDNEYKAINPPTSFEKKKTKKQRRMQRQQKELAFKRQQMKIEKKKLSDIYKLRHMNTEMEETEKRLALAKKKKALIKEAKAGEPKRLTRLKFEDPSLDFSRSCELRGNLRGIKPGRSMLLDRFYSFQKRNILAPTVRQNKTHKAKMKRYTKASHKVDDERTLKKLTTKKKEELGKITIR